MLKRSMDWSYERIKLLVLANLLRLSVDVYGASGAKEGLKTVAGEEFVLSFPALNGSIVIKPQGDRILTAVGESENPVAIITINVNNEKIFDVLEDVSKSSPRWGLIKLFFKYILWRRIKIKGSWTKASVTFKSMMFGDFEGDKKSN